MKNNQTANELSGIRLMRLMSSRLLQIVRKEHNNENSICLYGTGEYWSAFEKSAYLLCQLFPEKEVFIAKHIEYPFPIVMTCISDDELRKYGRTHIFHRDYSDYKELYYRKPPTVQYHIWHRDKMNRFGYEIDTLYRKKN